MCKNGDKFAQMPVSFRIFFKSVVFEQKFVSYFKWISKKTFLYLVIDTLFKYACAILSYDFLWQLHDCIHPEHGIFPGDEQDYKWLLQSSIELEFFRLKEFCRNRKSSNLKVRDQARSSRAYRLNCPISPGLHCNERSRVVLMEDDTLPYCPVPDNFHRHLPLTGPVRNRICQNSTSDFATGRITITF